MEYIIFIKDKITGNEREVTKEFKDNQELRNWLIFRNLQNYKYSYSGVEKNDAKRINGIKKGNYSL